MVSRPSVKRVLMARKLAKKWVQAHSDPRYRVTVLCNQDPRQIVSLLSSWRDGRIRFSGLPPITDLGIKTGFDFFEIWSSNQPAIEELVLALEKKGFETSGVF